MLGVGEVLPFSPTRRRAASLPVDVARTIEEALASLPLDIVHVHEPFAPSASSVALRHSRALNVGSFHAPTERILSTQLTRPLSRAVVRAPGRPHGQLPGDPRSAPALLPGGLPGDPAGRRGRACDARRRAGEPVRVLFSAGEERAALRLFLRALRAPRTRAGLATPRSGRRGRCAPPATLSRALRERVRVRRRRPDARGRGARAAPTCWCWPRRASRPVPGTLVRALAAGVVPVASRLPAYEELLGQGEYGFEFEPGDVADAASHLRRG